MVALTLKPAVSVSGSVQSAYAGMESSFRKLTVAQTSATSVAMPRLAPVQMSRVCDLTGKKANNGYVVTFSHKRNKKLQGANLQYKRVYWPEGERYIRMRLSTKAIKTIEKKGLGVMAKEAGIDLSKLPYQDARPARLEWIANPENNKPAVKKNKRACLNPETAGKNKPPRAYGKK